MARHAPEELNVEELKDAVVDVYARVAEAPDSGFHFHVGAEFAANRLGYDKDALGELPTETTACFAGVGNPHAIAPIESGATVLDIGSGGGTDLLLAARAVGPEGQAIGVDITAAMLERARASALAMGASNVELRRGDAMSLPVDDESIDVVISNGVLNLTPNKIRAFNEIYRVLKPGGRAQIADIILGQDLSLDTRKDIDLWTG